MTWRLGEAIGVEVEYMAVDRTTLDVMPVVDRVLAAEAGTITTEVVRGPIEWSNELALHVIELKSRDPVGDASELLAPFQRAVETISTHLGALGGRLLPTAMHPWMDPGTETRLWPHDYSPIYLAYHRIFDCRGHGWSNLQSLHLNFPFADDEEFGRLHAAVRVVLPILPALAASSPVAEGRLTGTLDTRMVHYGSNSRRIPSVSGLIVPEAIFTIDDYHRLVLAPMYADVAPHDPEGVLADDFLNARGAIPRFARSSLEIRVLDVQESPLADLAVAALVRATVEAAATGRFAPLARLAAARTEDLQETLSRCIERADEAVVDEGYARLLGWTGGPPTAGELWRHLFDATARLLPPGPVGAAAERLVEKGPLARRLLEVLGPSPDRQDLRALYTRLADVLLAGDLFLPDP